MKLYEVWTVYVEDQKKPIIAWQRLVARDQEEAKIKSGLLKEIDDTWDTDYLTVIVKEIGDVKVKEKPKEVKTIA